MSERPTIFDYGERGEVRVLPDAEALARDAADLFAHVAIEAVTMRGRASVALSGGSTPRRMGELLAQPPDRDRVPWNRIEVFWGDERWVPQESPESNAGTAKRTFLDRVPLLADQVHPFPTDATDPAAAAASYAATLRELLGEGELTPRFDLVLLGMGDDGHTASLFPETAALAERDALAVANDVPKLGTTRLTLTVPVLGAGREVVFLVSGAGKAETLAAVLEGPETPERLPAQLIRPADGRLLWLVDREAAARLGAASSRDG
jgi:6-phosphogluconolactonase